MIQKLTILLFCLLKTIAKIIWHMFAVIGVCSIAAGGSKTIHSLLKTTVTLPDNQEDFGNGLDMALHYDLLYDHPDWTAEKLNGV
jgi:hypothetical protein